MAKIFTLVLLALFLNKTNAQCSATSPTTSASIYSLTTVYSASMGLHVAICCNGILYDTLNNTSNMNYYLEPGGKLYKKGGVTTFVWMKASSTLINKGGTTSIMAYSESTATITNLGNPPVNNNTCVAVTNPQTNCYPLGGGCGGNGLSEREFISDNILIENPSTQNLNIKNANSFALKGELVNAIGQVVLNLEITTGKSSFDISNLKTGIYFLNVKRNDTKVSSKKLVIN